MKKATLLILIAMISITWSCKSPDKGDQGDFKFLAEQFYDIKVLRYQVPGFDSLTLQQKELVYYLSQAALSGRDITWDQNCKYNLSIRRTLENIYHFYTGDKKSENFNKFVLYLKRVEFSNGIHHHYSSDKFLPEFTKEYFAELVKNSKGGRFPLLQGENIDKFIARITPIIFDPNILPKKLSQNSGTDMIQNSAVTFMRVLLRKKLKNTTLKLLIKATLNPSPMV